MTWYYLDPNRSEQCTSSPEPEEESLPICSSDILPSVPSKLKSIRARFSWLGSETEFCRGSQSGMISKPLTENHGGEKLTLLLGGSHVKTSLAQEKVKESQANGQDYGARCPEWFAKWDRDTFSWRTPQCSLLGGLEPFSEIWPRWGIMQDGECFLAGRLVLITRENGFSYMPTITKTAIVDIDPKISISASGYIAKTSHNGKTGCANWALWMLCHSAVPTPKAAEYFMGWIMGWTALQPLGMDRVRKWRRSHGEYCQESNKEQTEG